MASTATLGKQLLNTRAVAIAGRFLLQVAHEGNQFGALLLQVFTPEF